MNPSCNPRRLPPEPRATSPAAAAPSAPGCAQPGTRARSPDEPALWPTPRTARAPRYRAGCSRAVCPSLRAACDPAPPITNRPQMPPRPPGQPQPTSRSSLPPHVSPPPPFPIPLPFPPLTSPSSIVYSTCVSLATQPQCPPPSAFPCPWLHRAC